MRRTARWCAVAAAASLVMTPATSAFAGASQGGTAAAAATADMKDHNAPAGPPEDVRTGKMDKVQLPNGKVVEGAPAAAPRARMRAMAAPANAQVGDVRYWFALNDFTGRYYLKPFQLKGVGDHIEIWVAVTRDANGNWAQALSFPGGSTGECRNTVFNGGEVSVTDAQVQNFIHEFDTNMFPKESEAFSPLVSRDGSQGLYQGYDPGVGPLDFSGAGDKVVTLVDNVRDANYYDPSTPDGQTYIAGFFSPTYTAFTGRNVMTIDAFDWLHRTGANPPDDSTSSTGCAYAGTKARPHMYEGTFAHEYQHLLEHDSDVDEVSWVNEGLSDWAQTLVGYVNTNQLPTQPTADSHVACFQGYLPKSYGGSENSLTMWGDQGGPEILCDYGAAYSFMEYLHGRFGGDAFMSALHKEQANGLEGLQAVLDKFGYSVKAQDVLHDFLVMMAVDHQIDLGDSVKQGEAARFTSPTLQSMVNWDTDQAYSSPGAPNNGADYVRARSASGGYLSGQQIRSLSFSGAGSYAPDPLAWTVDAAGHGAGDAALYSGTGDEVDNAAIAEVTVPSGGDTTLSFDTKYDTEEAWDFFFVQVSTDGGKTYTSLPIDGTTSDHDPSAYPTVQSNVPGFTGASDGWVTKTYDLKDYAGQKVMLSFRYVTDWGTHFDGVWIDNVKVAGTQISDGSSTDGFRSMTQVSPIPVAGWTLQLIGYGGNDHQVHVARVPLTLDPATGRFNVSMDTGALRSAIGPQPAVVSALVTVDDPTESARKYATYTLKVNGVTQPGGGE